MRELLIKTEQDGPGGVLVAVQDSGPGLKPESMDRLFDAFYTTKPDDMGMAAGGRLRHKSPINAPAFVCAKADRIVYGELRDKDRSC